MAFVKELKREDTENDRVIFKWKRPEEIIPGLTPSLAVIVSSIKADYPFFKEKIDDTRMLWIPEPSKDKRIILKIFISKPHISEMDLKKIFPSASSLI
jgi:hypothetical protein